MRVLLIDDEPMVRKTVQRMLERAGHFVVDAEDGRVGLAQLHKEPFDLVLTDIIMPEIEGLEVLMTARRRSPALAVIAMSGSGHMGKIDPLSFASRLGAAAVLQKPFTYDALLKAIEETFKGQMVA